MYLYLYKITVRYNSDYIKRMYVILDQENAEMARDIVKRDSWFTNAEINETKDELVEKCSGDREEMPMIMREAVKKATICIEPVDFTDIVDSVQTNGYRLLAYPAI